MGADIGKPGKDSKNKKEFATYEAIGKQLNAKKKELRRVRKNSRMDW